MTTPEQTSLPNGNGGGPRDRLAPDQWTGALVRFGRAAVLELRTTSRRRTFAPALSVHSLTPTYPLGARIEPSPLVTWSPDQATAPATRWDWHLRRDLASRLLEQVAAPKSAAAPEAAVLLAWTRSGPATTQDGDAAWWAAIWNAAADVRVPVRCLVVVTRWGWWTLPDGPECYWERLRDRRVRAPAAPRPAAG